ncbi:hypothetical protein [Magnetospirillum molischianum]|uniref:Uncharacterized protein n=1 Tax=Magnetospirillum molischianum DSM 120 TaxID=1150626 RepID=H8FYA8_MAGML|nr:hypothetical protein [Magnetospirillum molischianum]CCG43346.1 hypothetical protein PHAMO_80137 [Magnetospirillum molischianum DSM 120]
MGKPRFCPYCMSGDIKDGTGAFLEMGEYLNGRFESEGDADGFVCDTCGGEFWVNGPNMPTRMKEEASDAR